MRRSLSGASRHGLLDLEIRRSVDLSASARKELLTLCAAAYGEDLSELFRTFETPTHVLGRVAGVLVSHAMWVTRWLQPGLRSPVMTAYVEFVATAPDAQRRGYATRVMQCLATVVAADFELAALCPASHRIYERLGWRFWRGPLAIRLPGGALQPTPEERVMVLELPRSPALNLEDPLSAEWRPGEPW